MNLNDNNIKNKNLLSVKENSTSELKNLAKEKDIAGYTTMKKAELIDALK